MLTSNTVSVIHDTMLHFYDTQKILKRLAIAGAVCAALAVPAHADNTCTATDGYASQLTNYVSEMTACLSASPVVREDIATTIRNEINAVRRNASAPVISSHDGLNAAARAHALDMAARTYLAHEDLEGRSHSYRLSAIDRQALVGAIGANVYAVDANSPAESILASLGINADNAANLVDRSFTHSGVGIAEADGNLIIVTLLASVEGELFAPLPVQITKTTPIRAKLTDSGRQSVGWALTDADSGEAVAFGTAPRLNKRRAPAEPAKLEIIAANGLDEFVLKGPLVSSR